MSDISTSNNGEIAPNRLLIPYVTPYTNKTPAIAPLLVTALSNWAALMIEWGSLRWIDHAPAAIWIGSTFIAVCVATIIANKDWLNFKNRRYFPWSLTILMTAWIALVASAYYLDAMSNKEIDPVIANLQSQLAIARRDRDLAILERDDARRANGIPIPPTPKPSPPPTAKVSDIDARIDAWKAVAGLMNDFDRIFGEGDLIVANWTSDQFALLQKIAEFNQHVVNTRNRLNALIGTYSDFSDLRVINTSALDRLSATVNNLLQAVSQAPPGLSSSEKETSFGPFIGPLKRELVPARQWALATKNLANSSVSDLASREVSK